MAIHLIHSALHGMIGCSAKPSRDGVLLTLPNGTTYDLVTAYSDEGELLAAVDALAGALRARGAVAATTPAPVVVPAPAMPLAFTSALPVTNIEVPPDVVIAGGKVLEVKKVDAPAWEAPKVEPVAVAVKRRGKGAK